MLRMHAWPQNTGVHSTNVAIIKLNKYIKLTTNIQARLDKQQKWKYQGPSPNSWCNCTQLKHVPLRIIRLHYLGSAVHAAVRFSCSIRQRGKICLDFVKSWPMATMYIQCCSGTWENKEFFCKHCRASGTFEWFIPLIVCTSGKEPDNVVS